MGKLFNRFKRLTFCNLSSRAFTFNLFTLFKRSGNPKKRGLFLANGWHGVVDTRVPPVESSDGQLR